jgi:hypothetical protein
MLRSCRCQIPSDLNKRTISACCWAASKQHACSTQQRTRESRAASFLVIIRAESIKESDIPARKDRRHITKGTRRYQCVGFCVWALKRVRLEKETVPNSKMRNTYASYACDGQLCVDSVLRQKRSEILKMKIIGQTIVWWHRERPCKCEMIVESRNDC